MDLEIDYDAPEPPHRQIAEWVKARIAAGEWGPNQRIASQGDLMGATGTAHTTVRRAIKVLRDEGIVYTVAGRGTYVCDPRGE